MPRKVLIEKIGETTIVRIWDVSTPDEKRSYAYNKGADYNVDPRTKVLTVEDVSKTNPRLSIYFDELDDNLGAANIQEYFDLLAENLFFLAKGSNSSSNGNSSNLSKIYHLGKLQIFKRESNTADALEVNDLVIGIIQNSFIQGVYIGGNEQELTSYNIINQIDF